VKRLERKQKEEYEFKNTGLAKQADFLRKMSDWMEDGLRVKLEEELGPVPQNLLQVISAGESLLEDRLHLLKIADTYGWSAVAEFTATDLARNEAEEKKLKKIAKEKEAKQAKLNERKWAAKNKVAHGEDESLDDSFSAADILDNSYDDDDGESPWHISDNVDITSDGEE